MAARFRVVLRNIKGEWVWGLVGSYSTLSPLVEELTDIREELRALF